VAEVAKKGVLLNLDYSFRLTNRKQGESLTGNSFSGRGALRVLVCAALLASLAVGAELSGRAASPPSSRTSVLLITIDTLRADHLGCYGYRRIKTPNIDDLARGGVRFTHTYAQVPLTLPSHSVILSGTYPMYNRVRDFTGTGLPSNVGIISESFRRHGYSTAAFVSAFVLNGSWGLRKGFDVYDDHFDVRQFETRNPGNIQRRGDETVDRFLAWFAHRPPKPFFVWIHLYDPHSSYEPPEPFHSEYAGHLYDGEIAFDDAQLGRVFKALKDSGTYDRTIIAFLSDHGESLGEHGEDEHGFFIYNSTIHVPLIIKLAAAAPSKVKTVDSVTETVDLAPTLLRLAGVQDPLEHQFQGRSLAPLLAGETQGEAHHTAYAETLYPRNSFGWSPLKSLITSRYAFIEAPEPEIYDLTRDFAEKHNLYDEHRAEANALKGQLDGIEKRYAAAHGAKEAAEPPLPAETLQKLKSLGYLAYSAPAPVGEQNENLPDPKTKVDEFHKILRASDLSEAGRLRESDALLQEVARTETHLYLIPFMLGENASRGGKLKEAEEQFLACLKLNPLFLQALMGLARVYHADRQGGKAQAILELVTHRYPQDFQAYYGLAVIASESRQFDQAIKYFQACLRAKPDYGLASLGLGIAQVETKKFAEALPSLERAGDMGAQEPLRLNYLGIASENTGSSRRAIEYYRQALAKAPDYDGARLNLAFAYRRLGEMEKARHEFKALCDSGSPLCRQFQHYFE
jgi:arylsulfatase A-like enzyme/thioredoxin-like negative regulator of GroEL